MDTVSRPDLKALMEETGTPCVSIYMPANGAGAKWRQDPIRLRNLLRKAEERLLHGGMPAPEMRKLLAPARQLIEDKLFWQRAGEGLALFASPGTFRCYRLPVSIDELVAVGREFQVDPLLPVLAGDGRYFVLALSQNSVRLLECTRQSVREVDLPPDVPSDMSSALRYDDFEQQRQLYSGTTGKPGAVFFGQGVGSDVEKDSILRYFRQVDSGLRSLLHDEQAPLVIAAVDYLVPIYREASSYPRPAAQAIEGNPDHKSADELQKQAWAIVEPLFKKEQEGAVARYRQTIGTGQASSDLAEIVPAAYYGQVDTLLIGKGLQRWGAVDIENEEVQVHDTPQVDDVDLLHYAATRTLLSQGAVYTVEPETLPTGSAAVAVLRY